MPGPTVPDGYDRHAYEPFAVTADLAVTVGTLTAVPAVAATGAVAAAEQTQAQQTALTLLPGSLVLGNGPSGFLTRRTEGTQYAYAWTRYADGVTTTLPATAPTSRYAGTLGSDHVVKSEGAVHTLYDMATGADPVVIDTSSLGTSAQFVRLAGTTLVMRVTRPDGRADVHLVTKAAGALVDRVVTGLPADASVRRYEMSTPDTFDFRTSDGDGYLTWQFAAHTGAKVAVELTHTATGKQWTSTATVNSAGRGLAYWTGLFDDHTTATNGAYTWKMTATPTNGIGAPVERSGTLTVDSGQAPHGFSDTGSPDLIVREGSFLFVYDGRQALQHGAQTELKETIIGAGWDAYDQIVTPGNVAGARYADLVARDKNGALWLH
ncbi:hypothetical protein ACFW89_35145, partial [Streptomyces albidoflavus]